MDRFIGKVKWWNSSKGYGYIAQYDGPDIFVHVSALKAIGVENLTANEHVEYFIERGPKGNHATHLLLLDRASVSKENSTPPVVPEETPSAGQDSHVLRVFLCHSSNDKPLVRKLYQRLKSDNFDPWLDEEKLLPGQDWKQQISKAVRKADVVIVCLSHGSINKAGYVQKEITYALDIADEQPEDTIYLIPLKLEECDVPERLSRWHWVNYFEEHGYKRLLNALNVRAGSR